MKIIGLSIAAIAFSVCFSSCTALSRWLCTDNVMPDIMEVSTFAIDSLHDCDLLFQASVSGNAITDVTRGVDDMNIDHVGVFARIDGRPSVIEALPGHGVCVTPLDSFLCRRMSPEGVPQGVVGRVTGLDVQASLNGVQRFIGCNYDSLYLPGNREIYCSELVQFSFVDGGDNFVFESVPMTFRDSSGHIPDFWTRFYARHGMAVPEGRPGTNPGEMSRRKKVRIVMRF